MSELPRDYHLIQGLLDHLSAGWQEERAATQMTLGALIELLKVLDPFRMVTGLGKPDSYRGYYSDLAFEPSTEDITVAELLRVCQEYCMGQCFQGYKGGDFWMTGNTPLWVASYGTQGPRLMGLDTRVDPIIPSTAQEEEDQ